MGSKIREIEDNGLNMKYISQVNGFFLYNHEWEARVKYF